MLKKIYKYLLSALLFLAAFVYWGFFHYEFLFFHEYYQMFLFSAEYFVQRLSSVGGLSDYIAEFLTQFYVHQKLGAAILGLLFVFLQLLTNKTFKIFNVNENFYPFTFLPSLLMWSFLCNENLMLNFFIAVLINVLLFVAVEKFPKNTLFLIVKTIIYLFFYFLTGPSVVIAAFLDGLKNYKKLGFKAFAALIIIPIEAWLMSRVIIMPVKLFYDGFDYIRFPFKSYIHLTLYLLCPLLPFVLSFWKKLFSVKQSCIAMFGVVVIGFFSIFFSLNNITWQTIRMYEYVYQRDWDSAINFYDKYRTPNSYSVQCLNLALSQKGLLTERMFHYQQPGIFALTVEFQPDMFTALPSAEVFYILGAYNLAQRYAFESQENISNFRYSSKLMLRLAKLAIINKNYPVARKYLLTLSKTLFYKIQAKKYLQLLEDESKIKDDVEFSLAESIKLEIDGTQEELQADVVFENLIKKNPKNIGAIEYFQAYAMLTLDSKTIRNSLKYIAAAGWSKIPRHVQEALVLSYYNEHKTLKNIPQGISQEVAFAFENKLLDNTFWQYAIFIKNQNQQ